jgi:hypothetical protein
MMSRDIGACVGMERYLPARANVFFQPAEQWSTEEFITCDKAIFAVMVDEIPQDVR